MESEKSRILRAKKDIREFDYLYQKYFPKINNFVYHRTNNESIKNEIVSNVFFKAMNKLSMFRFIDPKRCSFSSWLFRIAVNEINQYFRNYKRENKIKEMYKINTINPVEEKNELNFAIVKEKMKNLTTYEQNLITLRFFEKLSYKELKEIFKKNEGALKVKLHRTLKKLRDNLKKEYQNEEF